MNEQESQSLLDNSRNTKAIGVMLALILIMASGTFLTPQIADMNQMIADLDAAAGISTGHTIQTVDLSGFPTF